MRTGARAAFALAFILAFAAYEGDAFAGGDCTLKSHQDSNGDIIIDGCNVDCPAGQSCSLTITLHKKSDGTYTQTYSCPCK
jgi:hypothetical protein